MGGGGYLLNELENFANCKWYNARLTGIALHGESLAWWGLSIGKYGTIDSLKSRIYDCFGDCAVDIRCVCFLPKNVIWHTIISFGIWSEGQGVMNKPKVNEAVGTAFCRVGWAWKQVIVFPSFFHSTPCSPCSFFSYILKHCLVHPLIILCGDIFLFISYPLIERPNTNGNTNIVHWHLDSSPYSVLILVKIRQKDGA